MIVKALFLFCTTGKEGRKSSALALGLLRLGGRMSAGQESADRHFSPCHHLGVWFNLGCFLLGWRGGIYWFFNGNVRLTTLRDVLSRFFSDRSEIVCNHIAQTDVSGFTRG